MHDILSEPTKGVRFQIHPEKRMKPRDACRQSTLGYHSGPPPHLKDSTQNHLEHDVRHQHPAFRLQRRVLRQPFRSL